MTTETQRVAETQPADGAATEGVAVQPTAAELGASGGQPGTPPPGTPRSENVVKEEDFRKAQRAYNQRIDALKNDLAVREQAIAAERQRAQQIEADLAAKDEELLRLRTEGLTESEARAERAEHEKVALEKRLKTIEEEARRQIAAREHVALQLQEREARREVIRLLVEGGETPTGKRVERHAQYGLTARDLENLGSPDEMEAVAVEKKHAWFAKQKEEIEREKASLAAQKRKDTGATKFDSGEPASGGGGMPKPGTPEFLAYIEDVKAERKKIRS